MVRGHNSEHVTIDSSTTRLNSGLDQAMSVPDRLVSDERDVVYHTLPGPLLVDVSCLEHTAAPDTSACFFAPDPQSLRVPPSELQIAGNEGSPQIASLGAC